MNLKKILISSFIVSNVFILLSFIFPIIPYLEYPNVPNPISVWRFRPLGYIPGCESNYIAEPLGFLQDISSTFFVVLFSVYLISFLILLLINKKSKRK